ncbi:MAG: 16S rRNA (adenine(1518)-N(6)/adenine(1519)-N(6))-dimethyltransferase RsmA [Candidatus Hodarchaeales archaeon]|jgi:16S rRNA (adenine1518-N6/adenine1519-N6)-dimethyltransferase
MSNFFQNIPQIGSRSDLFNYTNSLLKNYALLPKKSLGQHFMVDPHILKSYVTVFSPYKLKTLVEIGAGLGTLTNLIAQGTCENITIIEKDPNFALILERKFKNIEVINSDVLSLPEEFWTDKEVVTGNIPYEISSPLLFKLTKSKFFSNGKLLAFIVQKEFALKMAEMHGSTSYGKLSVNVQLNGLPKIVSHFGPGSFYPVPKVASSLITVIPRLEINPIVNTPEFQLFLSTLFTRKNRTIRSVLKNYAKKNSNAKLKDSIESDKNSSSRVKDLAPEEFIDLYERLGKFIFNPK